MPSNFLAIPIEVQLMVIEYITRPTDLKALCLVSKEISAFATPALYHQVDLTPRELTQDEEVSNLNPIPGLQIERIESLLSNKNNLLFIHVLITSECDLFQTIRLSEILESLGEDQLLELRYGNKGLIPTNEFSGRTENCFPDPKQMEFIWAHQGKLQTFQSTHLPTLFEKSAASELEMGAILQPIKELILIEETPQSPTLDFLTWPVENIDTALLQRLKLVGWNWQTQNNIQKLNDLFAADAFANMTELYMKEFLLSTPLLLSNCESLRSLTIVHFQSLPDGAAMVSIPHALQLTSFHFIGNDDFNQYKLLPSILRQIQGLSRLVLEITSADREDDEITEEIVDEFRTELAYALEVQQGTLTELIVKEQQPFDARIVFGGEELFGVVQRCRRLQRLALPLGLEDPIPRYTRLMKDLPNLAYFWQTQFWDYVPHDTDEETATQFKNEIPDESRLQFFAYEYFCYSRQELGSNELATRDKADGETVRSPFTRIDWERANPLFHNRYPSVPILPRDWGP